MEMNGRRSGWIRLWITACVFAAFATGWIGIRTKPSDPTMYWALRVYNDLSQELSAAETRIGTSRSVAQVQAAMEKQSTQIETLRAYQEKRQWEHGLTVLGAWIGLCLGLGLLILVMCWVIKGFRKPQNL